MFIESVTFEKFKQFRGAEFLLKPGVTLLAGGNNAGKSSLLHGLAVWEFCKVAALAQRGDDGLLADQVGRQGFGIGDDKFSPINVPTLKHLWSNLNTQKSEGDVDGYTLLVSCKWIADGRPLELGFRLALANDRLFIKVGVSNLSVGDRIPAVAYLPPFAGITSREERIRGAARRRRIGEGLAGAVLRNLLLDMDQANSETRQQLRGGRTKINDLDLRRLRQDDPWELLQQTLREVFAAEIQLEAFSEEYHTYIRASVVKGTVEGYKLTRHHGYNPRDLMVEGSGFLQWLSVYALATSPDAQVLLFDEPDAHLHPGLQKQMLERLESLTALTGKQVLLATHSTEILKSTPAASILHIRSGGVFKYLSEDHQKIGLFEGIGSDYAPRMDTVRRTKRVFFFEGRTDIEVLKVFAGKLEMDWPTNLAEWQTPSGQKERKALWRSLDDEFQGIMAFSLVDRDDSSPASTDATLSDKTLTVPSEFRARKWRRRYLESYLIYPHALALASGKDVDVVNEMLRDVHALAIGPSFTDTDAPQALMDSRAKEILESLNVSAVDVAKAMPGEAVCDDIRTLLAELLNFSES